jgi:hypothetical protein
MSVIVGNPAGRLRRGWGRPDTLMAGVSTPIAATTPRGRVPHRYTRNREEGPTREAWQLSGRATCRRGTDRKPRAGPTGPAGSGTAVLWAGLDNHATARAAIRAGSRW